jgi:hypothetical protein
MGDVRDGPEREGRGEAPFGADAVDDAAPQQIEERVGALEPHHHGGVVGLAPAEFGLQVRGLQDAELLAVDVVDDDRGEEQRHNHPAVIADLVFRLHTVGRRVRPRVRCAMRLDAFRPED